jgi:hypothetical protein
VIHHLRAESAKWGSVAVDRYYRGPAQHSVELDADYRNSNLA